MQWSDDSSQQLLVFDLECLYMSIHFSQGHKANSCEHWSVNHYDKIPMSQPNFLTEQNFLVGPHRALESIRSMFNACHTTERSSQNLVVT